jgi:hypothetical protein
MDHYIYRYERAIWLRAALDAWRFAKSHVKWEIAIVLGGAVIGGWRSDLSEFVTALQGPGWGLVILRSLVGAFSITVVALIIAFLGALLVAPARIHQDQLRRISELKNQITTLETIPPEPDLTAALQFQNDLAELVIRNTGAATTISARWKVESHTPQNLRLPGMPSGYQDMAFAGGSPTAQLDSQRDVQRLRVAECQVLESHIGPGGPPNYGWTIPYLKSGQIVLASFPSEPASPNPAAPYARLVFLIEVRPQSGLTAETLVRRVAIEGHTCISVEALPPIY